MYSCPLSFAAVPRNEIRDEYPEMDFPQRFTKADMMEKLLTLWMSKASDTDITRWARAYDKQFGGSSSSVSKPASDQVVHGGQESSDQAAATNPTLQVPASTGDAPQEEVSASGGQSSGSHGASGKQDQSILNGCPEMEGNVVDHTETFTNTQCGPPLPDHQLKKESLAEIVHAGEQGLIPAAALIKIMQGFDELPEGTPLALLLAGRVCMSFCKLLVFTTITSQQRWDMHPNVLYPPVRTDASCEDEKVCGQESHYGAKGYVQRPAVAR